MPYNTFEFISDACSHVCRIEWVWLGHGKAEEIMPLVDVLTFSDIWEIAAPVSAGVCPEGYK